MTITNQTIHSAANFINQVLGSSDLTWDEANFSWDSATGTWLNPYGLTNQAVHTATITNQALTP